MIEGELQAYHRCGVRRSEAPEVTLGRLTTKLDEFGITRVANITGLDRIGIPVVTAIRPASRSLVVSQGKGLCLIDAKVSAIMESIEMFHAERPDLSVRIASLRELLAEDAHVIDCAMLPRNTTNEFDDAAVMAWTPGTDLVTGSSLLVPYGYVAVDDTLSSFPVPDGIPVNSNGLASGNTNDEAIAHALCELVERDAIALWHLGPEPYRSGTNVDSATIDDPDCRILLTRYEDAGVDVHVFDITSDIGIPTYEVLIREPGALDQRDTFAAVGSGCHPWRSIALSRALTEAAQCRLTHIAGARGDLVPGDYAVTETRRGEIARYLALARMPGRRFRPTAENVPDVRESLTDTVARIVTKLRAAGILQVVAVDLTSARHGIAVVRMLVPGLEGLSFIGSSIAGNRVRKLTTEASAAS